jgi:hypothetical protein
MPSLIKIVSSWNLKIKYNFFKNNVKSKKHSFVIVKFSGWLYLESDFNLWTHAYQLEK